MTPHEQGRIAIKVGNAAHAIGVRHTWNVEDARDVGRKEDASDGAGAPRGKAMTIALVPLTNEARDALDGQTLLPIPHVPFKIGRKSRSGGRSDNDLDLVESSSANVFHVSRQHLAIEQRDSIWFLIDRKSTGGTLVNGKAIGGNRKGGRTELRDGDVIVLGTVKSPYVYRFQYGPSVTRE